MVKRLIIIFICTIILSNCNNENECDYDLINQELRIDESTNYELLLCNAYRDALTDGAPLDIFVLKIEKEFLKDYLKDNIQYREFLNDSNGVLSPFSLIDRLNNDLGSSSNKDKYRELIAKIDPENSFYFYSEKENYYVESLIDKNGYIVLSIGR